VTSTASLQYRLVRAATSAAIDTIAEVDAAGGGVTVVDDYTANLTSRNVTGLTATTTYFFAVVVRDAAGNKTIYTPANTTTSAAGTTASPVFNPAPGTFGTAPNLQMTSATSGAAICYTSGASPATPVCDGPKTGCATGTLYSSAISVGATATYKAIACKAGNTDSSETSGLYTIDTTAPTVASTTPADNSTGAATSTTIAITFSETMTPSTLKAVTGTTSCIANTPTVLVSSDNFANCIAMNSATLSTSDNITFTMTPTSALSTATQYKVRVTTGAQDAVGNAIAAQYTSPNGFTTALAGALTINSLTPASGTYNTAQAAAATTTETGSSICYTTNGVDPTAATPGTCDTTFVNEGQTIAIGSTLTLKVLATKAGHTNSAVMTRNYTISPTVTGSLPANGDTGVDPAGTITIGFSKTMNRTSFSFNAAAGACTGNIQVSADNFTNCIGFTIPAGNASSFVLTPAATLASATTYKVKVTTGAQDTSGNAATAFEHATGFTTRYFRTITIDGTDADWSADEIVSADGGAALSWSLAWDTNNLYLRVKDKNFAADTAARINIYIDTNPGDGTNAAGTEFAFDYDGGVNARQLIKDSRTKFNADYYVRVGHNGGADFANLYAHNSANYWNTGADLWDGTCEKFVGYDATHLVSEIKVPFAKLGSPTGAIRIIAFVTNSTNDYVYSLLSGQATLLGEDNSVDTTLQKYFILNKTQSTKPNATSLLTND
jgi:hypothetical protein